MIFDLTTYQFIWWLLVGIVLIIFCVTAGFDLGVGMLFCWVGRTNDERRLLLNVIGPNWDGNQVWLIIAGVALFGVWPRAYAVAFTGFYGGLMLMLWSLYMRPTGFEWRSKIDCAKWRAVWDWGIFIGSFMPAFAPGLLFGNILQGLDFQFDNEMRFQFVGHVEQLFNPFAYWF
jgi:cytochrome d ubiquinol oxidase subunit II